MGALKKSFRIHIKIQKQHFIIQSISGIYCFPGYVTSTVVHSLGLSEMLCGISKGVKETTLPLGTILITSRVYFKDC